MVSVIRQETSLFEGGGRGRILQLVYDNLLSECPCRQPASSPSGRSRQLELCAKSSEPVWVMKDWTICACFALSFRTKLAVCGLRIEMTLQFEFNFCIVINQF